MKRYAQTQDEMAAMLGISRQQFGKYASKPGAPVKQKSGYNVEQWTAFYREQKKDGLTGDGSMRDEKLKRECEKLDIQIAEMRGELVNRKDERARYMQHLVGLRKKIDDWTQHETAKFPSEVERIEALSNSLIDWIKDGSA